MSYANGTQHYNLPQTEGSDKRDWFDTNEAFRNIDTDLHSAKQTAETTAGNLATTNENVTRLTGRVATAESNIRALEGNLATTKENLGIVSQAVNGLTTTVAGNKQDLKDSICAIEEDTARASMKHEVGTFFWYNDTLYKTTVVITKNSEIVPDVNCSTTNITTELLNGSTPEVLANVVRYDSVNKRFEYNNNGAWTVIPSGTVVAQNVGYTDTLTQLGANNVQGAIVALKTLIDNIIGGGSMKMVKSGNVTVQGQTNAVVSLSDLGFSSREDFIVILSGAGFTSNSSGGNASSLSTCIIDETETNANQLSIKMRFGTNTNTCEVSYQVISLI